MLQKKCYKNLILSATLMIALTACGNQMAHLPDDQDHDTYSTKTSRPSALVTATPLISPSEEAQILTKYDYVDPQHLIRDSLIKEALIFYEKRSDLINNKSYLSVIDFSLSSKFARFFIIDMKSGAVWAIHTAHGKGSDANSDGVAESFSNSSGSDASSLGYYLTAETYFGKHGLSLRLDGISDSNSNVRARGVVIHGADYVQESNIIQGRSWGCPAVTMANRDRVVNSLKGGSLIYAGVQ